MQTMLSTEEMAWLNAHTLQELRDELTSVKGAF